MSSNHPNYTYLSHPSGILHLGTGSSYSRAGTGSAGQAPSGHTQQTPHLDHLTTNRLARNSTHNHMAGNMSNYQRNTQQHFNQPSSDSTYCTTPSNFTSSIH
ncbi:hypothetical protein PCANC_26228 [Puccinia coronata f. sp. avenae]|uniref:Uncharacterized protein n=1 Tax=Puccinia coronata f. sp. avenae TaxID=200324 RepID=A0A2N5S5Q6_9BASI|nr:hypothetical protein PCANC_26228 [Puccinia coronata f. sp. avenae]